VKTTELRKMSSQELAKKLQDLKQELFNLRFQHAVNQLDNPHKISDVKKDIARVKTVLNEKDAVAEDNE
jgi:large subunit ribosomal protein L29